MPNRLAESTSPYLLQHATNPVEWEPWDDASLERSRREDKPIFLSIGYSACHWCHVMEHESFLNKEIAAQLAKDFISIKVDREERPDLDSVYMTAVQNLTGRGGWPMSVFLTPSLEPFFAGTYWPPEPRMGMPGFSQVLSAVAEAWRERRDAVVTQAREMVRSLERPLVSPGATMPQSDELLVSAATTLARTFDRHHGGFGAAPKFPHPMDLRLLLRCGERLGRKEDTAMVVKTLESMAAGGIHDQLGGGFHRYSVDERWLVPHFEKMLYDNALLATTYLEAFQVTGRQDFSEVVTSTLDYLLRDMTDPDGGLWSTQDADSEGEEGIFYVWNPANIQQVLGQEEGAMFSYLYDVTPDGNFEGQSILNLPKTIDQVAAMRAIAPDELRRRIDASKKKLHHQRSLRVPPSIDDKVLVSWNGMAIDALARAGCSLGEERWINAAIRAATFILSSVRTPAGALAHQWRKGKASGLAFSDDLACLAEGLVSLYCATFDQRWLRQACEIADRLIEGFEDTACGGFYRISPDHERLLIRQHDILDNATPSATGTAANVLFTLGSITGEDRYRASAERAIASSARIASSAPSAVSQALLALDLAVGGITEAVVVGIPQAADTIATLAALRNGFRPRVVVAFRSSLSEEDAGPLTKLFEGRSAGPQGAVALYECHNRVCLQPRYGVDAVTRAQQLGLLQ